MRRRIATLVAATALSVATILGTAGPAHAFRCNPALDEACSTVFGVVCKLRPNCFY